MIFRLPVEHEGTKLGDIAGHPTTLGRVKGFLRHDEAQVSEVATGKAIDAILAGQGTTLTECVLRES